MSRTGTVQIKGGFSCGPVILQDFALIGSFLCGGAGLVLPSAPLELQVMDNNFTLSWEPGFTGYSELTHCVVQVTEPESVYPLLTQTRFWPEPGPSLSPGFAAVSPEAGPSSAACSGSSSPSGSVGSQESLQLQRQGLLCQRGGGVALFPLAHLSHT